MSPSARPDLGKLFLVAATKALIWGIKQAPIPGVGTAVELAEGAYNWFREQQEKKALNERLAGLEGAGACNPALARAIAQAVVAELRKQGETIESEREAAIIDLMGIMPSAIRAHTSATLAAARRHGTAPASALPISDQATPAERDAFYRGIFPTRRPRFQAGDRLPHYGPDWRLQALVGAGGFGEVWLAENSLNHRRAIKFCLDQRGARLLERERQNLTALQARLPAHPNLVPLLDLNLTQEPYWLAFDYVAGGTLEDLMRARRFTWAEALALFRPLCEGMAQVHQAGLIHSDLKPANILLTADETPRITDFGIGKLSAEPGRQAGASGFTAVGYFSQGYASPEQRAGVERHPSDDVYALGVILWQLVAGTLRFPHFAADIEGLAAPVAARQMLVRCLLTPRGQRVADAREMLGLLDGIAEDEGDRGRGATWERAVDMQPARREERSMGGEARRRDWGAMLKTAGKLAILVGVVGILWMVVFKDGRDTVANTVVPFVQKQVTGKEVLICQYTMTTLDHVTLDDKHTSDGKACILTPGQWRVEVQSPFETYRYKGAGDHGFWTGSPVKDAPALHLLDQLPFRIKDGYFGSIVVSVDNEKTWWPTGYPVAGISNMTIKVRPNIPDSFQSKTLAGSVDIKLRMVKEG